MRKVQRPLKRCPMKPPPPSFLSLVDAQASSILSMDDSHPHLKIAWIGETCRNRNRTGTGIWQNGQGTRRPSFSPKQPRDDATGSCRKCSNKTESPATAPQHTAPITIAVSGLPAQIAVQCNAILYRYIVSVTTKRNVPSAADLSNIQPALVASELKGAAIVISGER